MSPVLGFVVVVAAGLERIFSRTTQSAVALDELRRGLARERRLLVAGTGEYADPDGRVETYVRRSEEHLAAYDAMMVDYAHHLVERQG